jgi:acetyl-CoA carboxylase carboxyltransferase component
MGAEQLSGVMEIVMRESAEAQGKPVDEDGIAGMKAFIVAEAEKQSLDYFISGMVYDDGVIDPRDTRSILGICLSAIHTKPVEGAEGFGVFRL